MFSYFYEACFAAVMLSPKTISSHFLPHSGWTNAYPLLSLNRTSTTVKLAERATADIKEVATKMLKRVMMGKEIQRATIVKAI